MKFLTSITAALVIAALRGVQGETKALRGGDERSLGKDEYAYLVSNVGYDKHYDKDWCITADEGVKEGVKIGFKPCNFKYGSDKQLWRLDDYGRIHSKLNPDRCMIVDHGTHVVKGTRLRMADCDDKHHLGKFLHNGGTDYLRVAAEKEFCVTFTGSHPDADDVMVTQPCKYDSDYKFTYKTQRYHSRSSYSSYDSKYEHSKEESKYSEDSYLKYSGDYKEPSKYHSSGSKSHYYSKEDTKYEPSKYHPDYHSYYYDSKDSDKESTKYHSSGSKSHYKEPSKYYSSDDKGHSKSNYKEPSKYYSSDYKEPSKSHYKEPSKYYSSDYKEPSKSHYKEPSKYYSSDDKEHSKSNYKEPSKYYSSDDKEHSKSHYGSKSHYYSSDDHPRYKYKIIKSTSKAEFYPKYKQGCLVVKDKKAKDDQPLMLGTCHGAHGWRIDEDGLIHSELNDHKCMQADRAGDPKVGAPLRIFYCNKKSKFQRFEYTPDKYGGSIRLKGENLCAAFRGVVGNIRQDPIILKPCKDETTAWGEYDYDHSY